MRLKNKEIKDINQIKDILEKCQVCRVAMNSKSGIYVVPVNFGYSLSGDSLEIYFHGADVGRKYEIASMGISDIGFELDCDHQLVENDLPCEFTYRYSSIIGNGKLSLVDSLAEKANILNSIMYHLSKKTFSYNNDILEQTAVFKIKVTNYTAKGN